jgi:hypothetical protein
VIHKKGKPLKEELKDTKGVIQTSDKRSGIREIHTTVYV